VSDDDANALNVGTYARTARATQHHQSCVDHVLMRTYNDPNGHRKDKPETSDETSGRQAVTVTRSPPSRSA
jgi:hypothetical protein